LFHTSVDELFSVEAPVTPQARSIMISATVSAKAQASPLLALTLFMRVRMCPTPREAFIAASPVQDGLYLAADYTETRIFELVVALFKGFIFCSPDAVCSRKAAHAFRLTGFRSGCLASHAAGLLLDLLQRVEPSEPRGLARFL
jgi:hypothetical protein